MEIVEACKTITIISNGENFALDGRRSATLLQLSNIVKEEMCDADDGEVVIDLGSHIMKESSCKNIAYSARSVFEKFFQYLDIEESQNQRAETPLKKIRRPLIDWETDTGPFNVLFPEHERATPTVSFVVLALSKLGDFFELPLLSDLAFAKLADFINHHTADEIKEFFKIAEEINNTVLVTE